jgi:NAD(P)-dependent dehydrogenase (short-subunit alcohol dehydrogenase family)
MFGMQEVGDRKMIKTNNMKLNGKIAVVTGGGGDLCSVVSEALSDHGASVAVLDIRKDAAEAVAFRIRQKGGKALAVQCDVTIRSSVEEACKRIIEEYGTVDILVNGAGGNSPKATTSPALTFFDIPQESLEFVIKLNLLGTIIPCQVFGRIMAEKGEGVILNFSSMNAFRPLTKIPAYSAAKAGVSNFTQWLAVHMSHNYSKKIRVNAVAPGFFITQQDRFLLVQENGQLTPRG